MKKFAFMLLGGVLALALVFGGYVVFAQQDEGVVASLPADAVVVDAAAVTQVQVQDDDAETEGTEAEEAESDTDDTTLFPPGFMGGLMDGFTGRFGDRDHAGLSGDEYLAEALGITVEELQAAHEAAQIAALEQAVAEGLLTQEQADQILASGVPGIHLGRFGSDTIDFEALLAEALGISVEELEDARQAAADAKLAAMVAEGVITQEQADMMTARRALQEYFDYDALNDAFQSIYGDAIDQMLADGVITQEQADALLENMPTFDGRGFGPGGGPGGRGGRGGHGPHGFFPGGFGPGNGTGNGNGNGTSTSTGSSDA